MTVFRRNHTAKKRLPGRRAPTGRGAVRRLALSRLISMAGTDASALAIGFTLYQKTHSTVWLSLSLLLSVGLGAVLAPVGGWLGDRFPRRPLMLGAELASAALFLVLAFAPVPALLLGLSVPGALLGAIFGATSAAAIATIASEDELAWANGTIGVGSNVGKTGGRLIGGVLIAVVGAHGVFLLDAASFLLSAVLIASVAVDFGHGDRRRNARHEGGMLVGFKYMARHPMLAPVVAAACVSTLVTSFSMTAEVPLVAHLGAGPVALGILTAGWGLGMVVGSWHSGRVLHRGNEATGVVAGRAVMAAGIGLVALMPVIPGIYLCYLIGGLGGGFMGAASQSLLQRNTPDHMRARVFGATEAARNVAFGVGVIAAGFVVSVVGPQLTYGLVGLGVLAGLIPMVKLVRDLGGPRALRPVAVPASA
jgi:MFS family permease